MKLITLIAFSLISIKAISSFAGPIGKDDIHAASATGFPGAFLRTVAMSYSANPQYSYQLLKAIKTHINTITHFRSKSAVLGYLLDQVGDEAGIVQLKNELGIGPVDAGKCAALLISDVLINPAQLQEIIHGLESIKAGWGESVTKHFLYVKGDGDEMLIDSLRAAVTENQSENGNYLQSTSLDTFLSSFVDGGNTSTYSRPAAIPSRLPLNP